MAITYNDRIKCSECRFARVDGARSSRKWLAYECGNYKSEFHKAILNVTSGGYGQDDITWRGCEQGELAERQVAGGDSKGLFEPSE
jgi:hypothetical protein